MSDSEATSAGTRPPCRACEGSGINPGKLGDECRLALRGKGSWEVEKLVAGRCNPCEGTGRNLSLRSPNS